MLQSLARLTQIAGLLLALHAFPPSSAQSAEPPSAPPVRPFAVGERLSFALSWLGVRAGTAVLEVVESPPVAGKPTVKFLTTATSSPVVTKFYPVDNRVETVADAETLLPHRMVFRRREGKKHNDFDVTFDHAKAVVTVIKDGVTEQLPLPPQTFDSLACLYYVRTLPSLAQGTSVVFNVHHDKKIYKLEVRVEGVEKVKGPWGKVDAVRILAIMPFQGIFLNEGNIQVWVTNDARRIPVMMKAKVVIGSVIARLESLPAPRPPS